jgi:hypothetical protein
MNNESRQNVHAHTLWVRGWLTSRNVQVSRAQGATESTAEKIRNLASIVIRQNALEKELQKTLDEASDASHLQAAQVEY